MKKPSFKKEKEQEIDLLTALRFVSVAQNDKGQSPYMMHCAFREHDVVAFDGILAAGYPVVEQLAGCPHTNKLIAALSKVRGQYSMVLLDSLELSISSDEFRALVPCIKPEFIDDITQHNVTKYPIGNSWKNAAEIAGMYCTDNAETIVGAAILTGGSSLFGTNASTGFVEAFTGWSMPNDLIVPKAFVNAVVKSKLDLESFSFNDLSLTFYFTNGAWLRTQLYVDQYPKLDSLLAVFDAATPTPIPADFWKAIEAVIPHSATGQVFFEGNQVRSHGSTKLGASHTCDGLPFAVALPYKTLKLMKDVMTHADFTTDNKMVVFYNWEQNIRGAVMKVKWGDNA